MALSEADRDAIEAAFDAAQRRTSAPLQAVVAETSSDYYAVAPLIVSLLIVLAAPWPLILFTDLAAQRIFVVQLMVALAALALFSSPRLRLALTPARTRRLSAHRAALGQFHARGGARAPQRNAVLIYVSLAERYARVIAGEEAAKRIGAAQWQGLIDALTRDIAQKGPRPALENAAEGLAALLAPHFPGGNGAEPHVARFHAV